MNIKKIKPEHIFFTNIVFGKIVTEKIIVCENDYELNEIINDYWDDVDFYYALSLKKINHFLQELKKYPDLNFVLSYSFKDKEIKEKKLFLNQYDYELLKQSSQFFIDKDFLIKSVAKIHLHVHNDLVLFSENLES